MPGPIIRNPTPEWMKAKNASVLDPAYKKIARTLAQLVGLDDPQSQVLGMMTPLVPEGQATLSKPLQKMGNTLADLVEGIKAYHGSPHDFDQFSLSKIGTGEGAQAYGHGLYFAESEGVAKSYRDALSQTNASSWEAPQEARDAFQKAFRGGVAPHLGNLGNVRAENLAADVARDGALLPNIRRDLRQAGIDPDWLTETLKGSKPKGRMYEVSIKADPEQLLDWDNPLPADSPLRAKLKTMAEDSLPKAASGVERNRAKEAYMAADRAELTGQGVYQSIARLRAKPGAFPEITVPDPRAAADELRQAGIPGIKYLDGGSRAAGEGSRNFVIFDDSLVSILKKYGVALPLIEGLRRKASANGGKLNRADVEGLF